ncbi:hypothetical protein QFC22_006729 [Naganishia vaughanmartiniae]|uniref:Uncharacterized protein n=1 Tax=Naganishia vaughanmartiniae TaxID=1424756 RepID=A0ACC2WGG8_9TREE|nr:hypothetical protein QFC22_006729 [Naganishia vaughanmartiniae]
MQAPTLKSPVSGTSIPVAIRSANDRPVQSEQPVLQDGSHYRETSELAVAGKESDAARPVVEAGKKKKKRSGSTEEDDADKGKRPCDMCRKRKIRCTPVPGETDTTLSPETAGVKCKGCVNLDVPCTYLYVNKRAGRPLKKESEKAERRGEGSGKGKQKKAASGSALPSPPRPPSLTVQPTQPDQLTYMSPNDALASHFFSPTGDLDSHPRPAKRQRTSSQNSRSQEPLPPAIQYDESFAWTPGLSIGSFGAGESHDKYEAQREFERYRSHSQSQPTDLFGNVAGYPSQSNTYQANNNDGRANYMVSGSGLAGYGGVEDNDRSLQPFVPDFTNFTGMQPSKPDNGERIYDNETQQNQQHQQQGHSVFSFTGNSAGGSSGPEKVDSNRHHQQPSYMPHRDNPANTTHSHGRPVAGHQRTSTSDQQPSKFMRDAFQEDTPSKSKISGTALPPCPQIEDVTSWSNVSFFISLHLRYQHAIMPIIHKPTFNNDLALRLDRKDEMFRAFLLSLGGQADSVATDRDYFYSQTVGDTTTATILLAQGIRLAFCLGLHEPTPAGSNGENIDHVSLQLRRRIFFQLYNTDKTDASSGMQILMNDFEGVPPYPLCIDDELITTEGNLPQPVNRPSYMTGFVANVQLMQILSECMRRHRIYQTSPRDTDVYGILRWIERGQAQMRQVIQDLPDVLGPAPPLGVMVTDQSEMFATQRANLLITAVSSEFALLDLKALADPTHDIASERESVGREMYSLLSSIPVEHLAANGESMRGKVLRIFIALLSNAASPEHWNQHVRDWWDIYSKVQFVQMIPMNVDSLLGGSNTL